MAEKNGYFSSLNQTAGWKACSRCGKVGIKDTFYGKYKEFCSLTCSRFDENKISYPSFHGNVSTGDVNDVMPKRSMFSSLGHDNFFAYMADVIFRQPNQYRFAPVDIFPNSPLSDSWKQLFETRHYAEIKHIRSQNDSNFQVIPFSPVSENFWFVDLIDHAGYFIKVKFAGISEDFPPFYINLRHRNLYPILYAMKNNKDYIMPTLKRLNPLEAKQILEPVKELLKTGNCLLYDLYDIFISICTEKNYCLKTVYEVIDMDRPEQFMTGKIQSFYGDWIFAKCEFRNKCIWVHPKLGFIRPPGWSQMIGQRLYSNQEYAARSMVAFIKDPATKQMYINFPIFESNEKENPFKLGMKLEVLDPFLYEMRVATVVKILRFGNMLVKFDFIPHIAFCIHFTSPTIYPAGFSERHQIKLYSYLDLQSFNWTAYMRSCGDFEQIAPNSCFPEYDYSANHFKPGMIVETFNLLNSGVVCYAFVERVVGRLLCLNFLTKQMHKSKWVDFESPNLFPFGFVNLLRVSSRPYIKFDSLTLETFISRIGDLMNELRKNGYENNTDAEYFSDDLPLSTNICNDNQTNNVENETIDIIDDVNCDNSNEDVPNNSETHFEPEPKSSSRGHRHFRSEFMTDLNNINAFEKSQLLPSILYAREIRCEPTDDDTFYELSRRITLEDTKFNLTGLKKKLLNWSKVDVSLFLFQNNFQQYAHLFDEYEIDGRRLVNLSFEQILKLIPTYGPALKFRLLRDKLRESYKLCAK